jgi:6-phosphogluconolactonase (cycloisomerase 2 family)
MKREIFSVAIASLLLVFIFSCKKENDVPFVEESAVQRPINSQQGFVYLESNEAGQNSIVSYFQNANGTLTYSATTATGGTGTGSPLGSQGALEIENINHRLFAVDAGSNSISSFAIRNDGSLMLMHTVASNGTKPVSLTVSGDMVYVVNATSANISGFRVGPGGVLTFIPGSSQSLSNPGAAPAQISFTPNGQYLIVTEKMTSKITSFPVNASGVAGPGVSQSSANNNPFGFDFSGNYVVVTEAAIGNPGASSVSTYSASGIALVSGPAHANQTAAGRAKATSNGETVYITNTGSNTISSFRINGSGTLQEIEKVAASTGTAPADITISGNDSYLYVINGTSHSISAYKIGPHDKLQSIGVITGVPANAAGLIAQ